MPYVRPSSNSPPRQFSPSPDPQDINPGPSKRPKLTPADHQRLQLEKLLQNPEKEVQLPQGTRERTLRAPRDIMKNVQGSSAGAGSGEFHVYKQSRRREYERIKIMNDKAKALEEQAAFKARQAERDAITSAKTAKNRAKRLKRKGKKLSETPGEASVAGRKLVNTSIGGGMVFKKPDEADDESGESEDENDTEDVGPAVPSVTETQVPGASASVPVIEEPKIIIHDDD